jgi:hypothetical protein
MTTDSIRLNGMLVDTKVKRQLSCVNEFTLNVRIYVVRSSGRARRRSQDT